jgi:hypothetical protein
LSRPFRQAAIQEHSKIGIIKSDLAGYMDNALTNPLTTHCHSIDSGFYEKHIDIALNSDIIKHSDID